MTRTRVKQQAVVLPLERIHAGRNVRFDLKNIDSLAESIKLVGLLQPLIVVPISENPDDGVEVIAGHRRLAACQKAFYDPVECHVRARGSDEWRLMAQLAENLEREPMTVLERAAAFNQLVVAGMTHVQIGQAFSLSGGHVGQTMKLLEYPIVMQEHAHEGTIGLHDVLAVPLEIALEADGRTLSATCRRGGRFLRDWARHKVEAERATGRKIKTKSDLMVVAIDGALGEQVRSAANEMQQTIGEWVGRACRAKLAEQEARRDA